MTIKLEKRTPSGRMSHKTITVGKREANSYGRPFLVSVTGSTCETCHTSVAEARTAAFRRSDELEAKGWKRTEVREA